MPSVGFGFKRRLLDLDGTDAPDPGDATPPSISLASYLEPVRLRCSAEPQRSLQYGTNWCLSDEVEEDWVRPNSPTCLCLPDSSDSEYEGQESDEDDESVTSDDDLTQRSRDVFPRAAFLNLALGVTPFAEDDQKLVPDRGVDEMHHHPGQSSKLGIRIPKASSVNHSQMHSFMVSPSVKEMSHMTSPSSLFNQWNSEGNDARSPTLSSCNLNFTFKKLRDSIDYNPEPEYEDEEVWRSKLMIDLQRYEDLYRLQSTPFSQSAMSCNIGFSPNGEEASEEPGLSHYPNANKLMEKAPQVVVEAPPPEAPAAHVCTSKDNMPLVPLPHNDKQPGRSVEMENVAFLTPGPPSSRLLGGGDWLNMDSRAGMGPRKMNLLVSPRTPHMNLKEGPGGAGASSASFLKHGQGLRPTFI